MENTIKDAKDLLECSKTKDYIYMTFIPTWESSVYALNGSEIEKVEEFLYLEGYMNSTHDVDTRIAKAWGALNAKVWLSPIKKETKTRVFTALT